MKTMKKSLTIVAMTIALSLAATGCGQKLAPADQTIGALFELVGKNNAAPMTELLGFASEQETISSFIEDAEDLSMAAIVTEAVEGAGIEISESDKSELIQVMTDIEKKISYTAEITSESSNAVEVTLHVKGYRLDDITDIVTNSFNGMMESITEEDLEAIQNGDMDLYKQYTDQFVKDYIAGLKELTINPETIDIVVSCEKLSVEAESGNKVAWLPTNMNKFATDVSDAILQE